MKVSLSFSESNPLENGIIEKIEKIKADELRRGRKTSNATAVSMLLSMAITNGKADAEKATPILGANKPTTKNNGVKK